MKPGDFFHVVPNSANWLVHGNTVTGCPSLVLGAHGSETTIFRNNLIAKGDSERNKLSTPPAKRLIDNQISDSMSRKGSAGNDKWFHTIGRQRT